MARSGERERDGGVEVSGGLTGAKCGNQEKKGESHVTQPCTLFLHHVNFALSDTAVADTQYELWTRHGKGWSTGHRP